MRDRKCKYCGCIHNGSEKAKLYHQSKECLKPTESDKLLRLVCMQNEKQMEKLKKEKLD